MITRASEITWQSALHFILYLLVVDEQASLAAKSQAGVMKEFAPLDALFLLLGCRVSRSPLSLALASDSNALILILI